VAVLVLTYLAIYVTALLVLPVEVAPLTVRVEELSHTSSGDVEEVECLTREMELGLGDV
jgi:hypothetical protein